MTLLLVGVAAPRAAVAATPELTAYVNQRAAECAAIDRLDFQSADEWPARRAALRRDLAAMLGLDPMPERGELRSTVTGSIERNGIVVEKLHFQSSPGLYVTANFYRPAEVSAPLPTILYLCGHSRVVENGISYGNKVGYQHHGAWFARNGYCCLTIDTLQLGEIEGLHHGTNREGMWWWVARGYTPAGIEAWNALRALDYLETRKEVDSQRIGVTGRSGGGAYSWWIAALDDRPKCFVPVAGITDLANHVVDGCIKGHCDCMYMVNRQGWDFGTLACLAAPRPCLLANSDRDPIFPLDGVMRVHSQLRALYHQLGADEKLGLAISEGPHKDTQELQLAAFRWLNRWLRGVEEPIAMVAEKLFTPAELRVFDTLPADALNKTIHETFVPVAPAVVPPQDLQSWETLRRDWLEKLRAQVFAAWPKGDIPLDLKRVDESAAAADRTTIEFTSERGLRLRLSIIGAASAPADARVVLHVIGEDLETYLDRTATQVPQGEIWAFIAPRGCDEAWLAQDAKTRTHFLRRFVLVGTTIDEGRVWDVRRAVAAVHEAIGNGHAVALAARGRAAGLAVYASLFSPEVNELLLQGLPSSHRQGPTFMNVLRVLDMPQALAMVLPRHVHLVGSEPRDFAWANDTARLYAGDSSAPALQFSTVSQAAGTARPPNIVFIMADDLGWADLGCTGSTFHDTPHLDRLAADGIRFTNAYSACPVCSPTRAAAMTGKYPARVKITDFIPGARRGKLNPAFYLHHLPLEEVTVAEVLRDAGYRTALVGKWHLGDQGYWPQEQGFDVNVAGSGKGGSTQISPYGLPNLSDGPAGEYLTDRLTDEAINFITAQHERPFLLWLTHYDVHTPLVAPTRLIDTYEKKAASWPASRTPRFRPEGARQDRRVQDHAIYAAKIASLDQSVGRVRAALADQGLADNTIVIFTSDNGGLSTSEGAPTSNAPLRSGKGWLYEGGIRVPLLVHWPGVSTAGRVCDVPVITNDLFPTICEMAGRPLESGKNGDGVSLVPLIKESAPPTRDTLYWHYPHYGNQGGSPGGAIREGDWKLIEFFEDNHAELYNLRADLGERHDVASMNPERTRQLRQKLATWRKQVGAEMPSPNPDFKP